MEARLRQGHAYALVTLTHVCGDLRQGRSALFGTFASLRRLTLWTGAVAGGEAHLQVKRAGPGTWNIHLHAVVQLLEGRSLASDSLNSRWRELLAVRGLTGDGHATHLKRQWALHADPLSPSVPQFVSKPAFYVTARKPGRDLPDLPMEDLGALLSFLPGKRRVSSFGCWRGKRRTPLAVPTTTTERKSP